MDIDKIMETFFLECAEQLGEVEEAFMTLRSEPQETEPIHAVFRAVHSIKGGAGAFGFNELVAYAHIVENGLDVMRNNPDPGLDPRLDLIARAIDVLADAVSATRDQTDFPDTSELSAEISQAFDLSEVGEEEEGEAISFDAVPIDIGLLDLATPSEFRYTITLKPHMELYRRGNDVQRLIRNLLQFGQPEIECNTESVPELDKFKEDTTYLTWTIRLTSATPQHEVASVFEWCEGDCEVDIAVQTDFDDGADFEVPDLDALLGRGIDAPPLVGPEDEGLPDAELAIAPTAAGPEQDEVKPASAVPITEKDAAAPRQKATPTIRVESEKVDRLINLMGEAVISQAMLAEKLSDESSSADAATYTIIGGMQALMREIQESVMAIRAQPVKPVFMRMSRVVREASAASGKKANLEFEGEATEVDTTIIESLNDPLTHMIRNSVDHGIEPPEERIRLGKPEHGTIRLSASHTSGRILVTVEDDGAGINRDRVLKKAIERGIVDPSATLSDTEIDSLIFAPGFSTAETVTDLSGRGVGMDVVRQSIQALGGRVTVSSRPGEGSQMRLTLPLTLAILDGMVVRVAGEVLVVPLTSVVETMRVNSADITSIGTGIIRLRDTLVPVINVGERLGFTGHRAMEGSCTMLVVEAQDGTVASLLIDEIEGQQQIVIKSLESNYERVPFVAAATILGTGKIALILDIDEMITVSSEESRSRGKQEQIERVPA
jgi:two-component system, chemotaxis family, sensor kinase CheA